MGGSLDVCIYGGILGDLGGLSDCIRSGAWGRVSLHGRGVMSARGCYVAVIVTIRA